MSSIGYRPKGESSPLYSPERDYAYITPTLMCAAIENLETDDPEIAAWRAQHNISSEIVTALAQALAAAQRDFVNAADPVSNFEQALDRRGFNELPFAARQFLFASVGYVFCAAWFRAVREVSIVNEDSPASPDMARFAAIVRAFAKRAGAATIDTAAHTESLQFRLDVLNSRIANLLERYHAAAAEIQTLKTQLAEASAPNSFWAWLTGGKKTNWVGPK